MVISDFGVGIAGKTQMYSFILLIRYEKFPSERISPQLNEAFKLWTSW